MNWSYKHNKFELILKGDYFMASKIFRIILERKIDIFAGTYGSDSNSLFKNEKGKLIHPGEYGMYREQTFKDLLRHLLSKDLDVSDGFIINSNDEISTQCDIIVYNHNSIPLIDDGYEKFYPIEEVNGIGEIKSDLNYTDFKQALIKLAKNKMLCDRRKEHQRNHYSGDSYIASFLVCKKLNFDILNLNLKDIYEDIPNQYWHNAILSLDDGHVGYSLYFEDLSDDIKEEMKNSNFILFEKGSISFEYPCLIINDDMDLCRSTICTSDIRDKYKHVISFLISITRACESTVKSKTDKSMYLGWTY